jgi:hypothetical protein
MKSLIRVFFPFVLLAALFARLASAQCPLPDNLDGGPCCALTTEVLPPLPTFFQNSLDICWRDCNVDQVRGVNAKFTPLPTVHNCGERMVRAQFFDPASGLLTWSGVLRLTYSRTWMEGGLPPATGRQVWRFLANGDLRPTSAAGAVPCPIPSCTAAFKTVRFTGYIDYAQRCNVFPAQFEEAWMLTHVCDAVDHAPGFPRAGVFHPDRSYSFVGPAAGFVPGPVGPTEGSPGSPFEALRRRRFPAAGTVGPVLCEFEERTQHQLLPLNQFCFCGPSTMPQFFLGNLTAFGACGTLVTTPGGPLLPGFLSMNIGTWTVPGVYPGVESLRWNAGNYDDTDPCTGVVRNAAWFGVTTIGGDPATQVVASGAGAPLPPIFIDQGTSIRTGGATVMNIPYRTDFVLNLNE